MSKLSDIAYAKIVRLISEGDYAVNSRLPTEVELSEQLAVSRPVVREALARLREDGVVASRRGSGTYVLSIHGTKEARLGPLSSIEDMRACLVFRKSLEGANAWHAAQRGGDMKHIDHAIERLESAIMANEIPAEDDFIFHLAVAKQTGNRFFESTMIALRESVLTSMSITRSFLKPHGIVRVREVHDEHLAIADAIRIGDAEKAQSAMHNHIDHVFMRAFGG